MNMIYKNSSDSYQTIGLNSKDKEIYSIISHYIKNNDNKLKEAGFESFMGFGKECTRIIHYNGVTLVMQIHLGSKSVKIKIAGKEKARKEVIGKLEKIMSLKFEEGDILLNNNS